MNEFTIASLLGILRKCIWYMVIVAVVMAIAAYVFCAFVATPTYQSSVSFVATNKGFGGENTTTTIAGDASNKITSADVAASLAMLNTYVGILQTGEMYEKLADELEMPYTARELSSMITVQSRNEQSLFIDVLVTSPNPVHSVQIANTFLELGDDYVVDCLPNAYMKAVQYSKGAVQNYPNTFLTILLAVFLGVVAVYGIAILITAMDKTIKGENDFMSNYDIPLLGNIPNFKTAAKGEKK